MKVNYRRVGMWMLGDVLIASLTLALYHASSPFLQRTRARHRRGHRERRRRLLKAFDSAAVIARRRLYGVTAGGAGVSWW
jgi:hypothetical protein